MITPVPCKTGSCGKLIFFAVTGSGKNMPVDYDSAGAPGGTLAVSRGEGGTMRCRVMSSPDGLEPGEILATSHYVTCARPADHRNRKPPAPVVD